MKFYHATTLKAALQIQREGEFRPGKRGYAGGAIYFATAQDSAKKHAFNGNPNRVVEVIIRCSVDLGRCLSAKRNTMDKSMCMAQGYDSVKVKGTDTYAVYDPTRIVIEEFIPINKEIACLPNNIISSKKISSEAAGGLIVDAIARSSSRCLNASDMAHIYLQHPGLREALGSSLKKFCEAHAELIWDDQKVRLAQHQSPAQPTPRREDAVALHKVRVQLRKEYRCKREATRACRQHEQCAEQEAPARHQEKQHLKQEESRARQQQALHLLQQQEMRTRHDLSTQQQEDSHSSHDFAMRSQQQQNLRSRQVLEAQARLHNEFNLSDRQAQRFCFGQENDEPRSQRCPPVEHASARHRAEAERSRQLSIKSADPICIFFSGIAHVLGRLLGF